jgi:hypothetical protein
MVLFTAIIMGHNYVQSQFLCTTYTDWIVLRELFVCDHFNNDFKPDY